MLKLEYWSFPFFGGLFRVRVSLKVELVLCWPWKQRSTKQFPLKVHIRVLELSTVLQSLVAEEVCSSHVLDWCEHRRRRRAQSMRLTCDETASFSFHHECIKGCPSSKTYALIEEPVCFHHISRTMRIRLWKNLHIKLIFTLSLLIFNSLCRPVGVCAELSQLTTRHLGHKYEDSVSCI